MKKLIVSTLMLFSAAVCADSPPYPHPEQFKEYKVKGAYIYILKDVITGCEYITRAVNDGYVLREGSCNKPTK